MNLPDGKTSTHIMIIYYYINLTYYYDNIIMNEQEIIDENMKYRSTCCALFTSL